MKKKIFLLVLLQICLITASYAQYNPCTNTNVNCFPEETQQVDIGHDWHPSHGSFSISPNNAPTSPQGGSIYMGSVQNFGGGAFTCYNFKKNSTYRVCFWVRNASSWPSNPFGRVYVYAANNLLDHGHTLSSPVPYASKQLIDQSYQGPAQGGLPYQGQHPWEFISVTFTANWDYNNLWIFPLNPMGPGAPGSQQFSAIYHIEVDDIRVIESPVPSYNISISSSKDTLTGCDDSTLLTLSGMPTGAVATWTPAVTTPNPTGNSVYAKPCSTTTYKIEIRDTSSACALCINEVLYKTIVVEPWSDTAKIIYPRSLIGCTDSFVLDYNDPLTCPQIGFNDYVWIDPLNRTYTGRIQNLVATSTHTGIWTLAIYNSKKGCSEELEFLISVGSCCISNPGFTFTGCNPVTFTNNSTGITLHTATLWNFGDGTSSNQFSPTHSYNVTSATVKNVCLTMMYQDSQSHSCCKRICQPVPVCPNPCAVVADFNFSQLPGAVNTFDFTDASTGTGTLCEYEWEFGDGSTTIVYSPNISHFYSTPGPWWVCLTTTNCIYDAAGKEIGRCTNKKCKWVYPPEGKKDPITGNPESEEQIPNQANILNIYPNPNAGDFVISLHNRKGEYQVIIRDKLGREVYRHLHTFAANPINIALQDIAPGIYTVEVKNDTEKFIEQISVSK